MSAFDLEEASIPTFLRTAAQSVLDAICASSQSDDDLHDPSMSVVLLSGRARTTRIGKVEGMQEWMTSNTFSDAKKNLKVLPFIKFRNSTFHFVRGQDGRPCLVPIRHDRLSEVDQMQVSSHEYVMAVAQNKNPPLVMWATLPADDSEIVLSDVVAVCEELEDPASTSRDRVVESMNTTPEVLLFSGSLTIDPRDDLSTPSHEGPSILFFARSKKGSTAVVRGLTDFIDQLKLGNAPKCLSLEKFGSGKTSSKS